VAFGYTDLVGNKTTRTVLPLTLVHPPQGVKLLAWCAERQDFRQFFVRSMQGPTPQPGDFRRDRMALLEGLLDKYTGRA
jgi:predicted DNA-binding transcriptional regulator YafY